MDNSLGDIVKLLLQAQSDERQRQDQRFQLELEERREQRRIEDQRRIEEREQRQRDYEEQKIERDYQRQLDNARLERESKLFMTMLERSNPNSQIPTIHNLPPSSDSDIVSAIELVTEEYLSKKFPDAVATTDTQPTPIERYMEQRFNTMQPELYKQVVNTFNNDPYFHRRFTSSINGPPLFIRPNEPDIDSFIHRHSPLMTPFIWEDVLDDNRRTAYRRRWTINDLERAKLLVFIDDAQANPEEYLTATNQAFKFQVNLVRRGNSRTTSKVVRMVNSSEIEFDPNAQVDPGSVFLKTLEHDIDLNSAKVRGISYFNSLIYHYVVDFSPDSYANLEPDQMIDAFNINLRKSVLELMQYRNDMKPAMVNIFVRYIFQDEQGRINERLVNVFKDRKLDSIHRLQVEEGMREQLISQGSDVNDSIIHHLIDYSQIQVNIIAPIAGGSDNYSQIEQVIDAIRNGKKAVSTIKIGRVKTYESNINDNSCFIRIIAQSIKNQSYRRAYPTVETFKTYLELWKRVDRALGLNTYKKMISLEDASAIAAYFHINIVVYDEEGTILKNDNIDTTQTLNILYLEQHYAHIIDMNQLATNTDYWTIPKRTSGKKKRYFEHNLNIPYDIETVYDTSLGSVNSILPYSVSYQGLNITSVFSNEVNDHVTEVESVMKTIITSDPTPSPNNHKNVVYDMIVDLTKEVVNGCDHLINMLNATNTSYEEEAGIYVINLVMIAYNGMGFDHHILFRYLANGGYHLVQSPTGNKIRSMSANLYRAEVPRIVDDIMYRDLFFLRLKVWDPYAFLARSLNSAALSFKIPMQKEALDHLQVQAAYENKQFQQFIEENSNKITSYNEHDVKILTEVNTQFIDTMIQSVGINPMNYGTIAGMCSHYHGMLLYKGSVTGLIQVEEENGDDIELVDEEVTLEADILPLYPTSEQVRQYLDKHKSDNEEVVLRKMMGITNNKMLISPRDHITDRDIRSAIIGGRVEGEVGIHRGELVMGDVVSLYPTVMMRYDFPIGEEDVITNVRTARRELTNNKRMGIYYCRVDQSTLNEDLFHPIIPIRDRNKRLNWKLSAARSSIYEGWVPDITIRQLKTYGAKVQLTESSDGRVAYTWDKSGEGALFREYIVIFGEMKKIQDQLARENSSQYNPAMREISKLMLNSLSGKMAERSHRTRTKFFSSEKNAELINLVNKLDSEGNIYVAEVLSQYMASITYQVEAKLRHTQVGVFIYAYSRHLMYELCFSKMRVLYSDTDSVIALKSDFDRAMKGVKLYQSDYDILYNGQGDKLFGMMEIEAINFNLIVIAPKFYMLYNGDNVIKYRAKGVGANDVVIREGEQDVLFKDDVMGVYNWMAQGKNISFRSQGISKSLKEGKIFSRSIDKNMNNLSILSIFNHPPLVFDLVKKSKKLSELMTIGQYAKLIELLRPYYRSLELLLQSLIRLDDGTYLVDESSGGVNVRTLNSRKLKLDIFLNILGDVDNELIKKIKDLPNIG